MSVRLTRGFIVLDIEHEGNESSFAITVENDTLQKKVLDTLKEGIGKGINDIANLTLETSVRYYYRPNPLVDHDQEEWDFRDAAKEVWEGLRSDHDKTHLVLYRCVDEDTQSRNRISAEEASSLEEAAEQIRRIKKYGENLYRRSFRLRRRLSKRFSRIASKQDSWTLDPPAKQMVRAERGRR